MSSHVIIFVTHVSLTVCVAGDYFGLDMLQLHKDLQNVLRMQKVNRESHDFLQLSVQHLMALEPDLKDAIIKGDTMTTEAAIRGFLMLAEAMKGPNYANQQTISNSGIFELADRIMGRIVLERRTQAQVTPPARKKKAGPPRTGKLNQVVPMDDDCDDEGPGVAIDVLKQNTTRCRLKSAVVECLTALLEGVVSASIPEQMLSSCNWALYTQVWMCGEESPFGAVCGVLQPRCSCAHIGG